MPDSEAKVFIVDDDPAVRDSLQWLIESVDISVQSFACGADFLESGALEEFGCVVLDIRMPGMSGIDVFEEMTRRQSVLPTIFLTGHGDVHLAVRAMKYGAFDFIEKPFNDQSLLDLIQQAIRSDRARRKERRQVSEITERMNNLSVREREVLDGVVDGNSNRIIASTLNLSEKTVEFHRSKMMDKMAAATLADLIRMITLVKRAGALETNGARG
ncbi:MAG: response regulator [Rhodospirillales bacterium]|jgi:FixJ family two-component response regulator|nr:DNA-binding response regulator [Rhodospirillaceae bacterium]MDP6429380.1 response regulator [Rhodospirillales bacterium]MDP6644857.1 response regulator [Rhodospirillales bacterium]MDP6840431.1 response regulator [Rhodospirillales bacterium]|tara:strand:- start:280 stop:924 length:645 start_codon:yes stop_codon:yes gene_type:complete